MKARLLEPLFAFDRQVAPAGSDVIGHVSRLQRVAKMKRTQAILDGDFTPLHNAEVEFTTLVLPDGRRMPLHTLESVGLNTIVPLHPPKPGSARPAGNTGVLGTGKRQAQAQVDAAKQRVAGIADMVRGPDKMQRLGEFLVTKLPYHPQWVRNRTRFDAELAQPLDFGIGTVNNDALHLLGTQPPADSVAHVRLTTALDSSTAKQGDEVQAVLSQPMFSSNNKLILPEGTHLTGAVTVAHRARWFHRGGQLRFSFQKIELPLGVTRPAQDSGPLVSRTQASLQSAEPGGKGKIKVDEEGGIKASEPKTRLLAPALALLIASRAADNDADRAGRVGHAEGNAGGRTIGGLSGFGLLGAIAAQSSHTVGTVFGFYGLAASVYTNIISRGSEVEFGKNAAMDIRFGARPPGSKSAPAR